MAACYSFDAKKTLLCRKNMIDKRVLLSLLFVGQVLVMILLWASVHSKITPSSADGSVHVRHREIQPGANTSAKWTSPLVTLRQNLFKQAKLSRRTVVRATQTSDLANESTIIGSAVEVQYIGYTDLRKENRTQKDLLGQTTDDPSNRAEDFTGAKNAQMSVHVTQVRGELPVFPTKTLAGDEGDAGANQYLEDVLKNCTNYTWRRPIEISDGKPRCPCIPPNLVGRLHIDEKLAESNVTWDSLNKLVGELGVQNGGHWSPVECGALQRLAIVIPCRDRESHLRALLNHLLPILVRQQVHFRIFVVEQSWPGHFNKGSMMNIGYKEALKLWDFDCVLFHDVDLLLQDDRNLYRCRQDGATHFGAYLDRYNFSVKYEDLFGGVVTMKRGHFEAANGFSTLYFGWGGEDDDFADRVKSIGVKRFRPPPPVARYITLKHERDESNLVNPYRMIHKTLAKMPWIYQVEGLNSIQYEIRKRESLPSHTYIMADLEVGGIPTYLPADEYTYSRQRGVCKSQPSRVEQVSRITCQFMCDSRTNCTAYSYTEDGDNHCLLYIYQGACKDVEERANFNSFIKSQFALPKRILKHRFHMFDFKNCKLSPVFGAAKISEITNCARACENEDKCLAFIFEENRCYFMGRPKCGNVSMHRDSPPRPPVFVKMGLALSQFTRTRFQALAIGERTHCQKSETIAPVRTDVHNCAVLCHGFSQCVGFTYTKWLHADVNTCVLLSSCQSIVQSNEEVYTFLKRDIHSKLIV